MPLTKPPSKLPLRQLPVVSIAAGLPFVGLVCDMAVNRHWPGLGPALIMPGSVVLHLLTSFHLPFSHAKSDADACQMPVALPLRRSPVASMFDFALLTAFDPCHTGGGCLVLGSPCGQPARPRAEERPTTGVTSAYDIPGVRSAADMPGRWLCHSGLMAIGRMPSSKSLLAAPCGQDIFWLRLRRAALGRG
jgi:hypothetical protein